MIHIKSHFRSARKTRDTQIDTDSDQLLYDET